MRNVFSLLAEDHGDRDAAVTPEKRARYLPLYLQETGVQLGGLRAQLTSLMSGGEGSLDELFRLAHTIKGSSLAMGLEELGALAHGLEDRLEDVRAAGRALSAAERGGLEAQISLIEEALEPLASAEPRRFVRNGSDGGGGSVARLREEALALASSLSKELRFEVEVEGEVEGEERVVAELPEELIGPLGHLIRNCVQHGLEGPTERRQAGKGREGRLRLELRQGPEKLIVVLEDDGRGMDRERLRARALELGLVPRHVVEASNEEQALAFCLLPGLSTAPELSKLAGRGIGMDAAARGVEEAGGKLHIESEPGRHTRFLIELPLPGGAGKGAPPLDRGREGLRSARS